MTYYFRTEEKVFSLNKTYMFVPRDDIKLLWEQFFGLLFVAGAYVEGNHVSFQRERSLMVQPHRLMSDPDFTLPFGEYHGKIGEKIAKALYMRFTILRNHQSTNDREKLLLGELDGLFNETTETYGRLSGKSLYGIGISRGFSADAMTVLHYVCTMYGQQNFPTPTELPGIYLSIFGNIYLAKQHELKVKVGEPTLPYGSVIKRGKVSPLWAFISAQLDDLVEASHPGEALCDRLSSLTLLHPNLNYEGYVGLPRAIVASRSLYSSKDFYDLFNHDITADFYSSFLFGCTGSVELIRQPIFQYILDDMAKKVGETEPYILFSQSSPYLNLLNSEKIRYQRYSPTDRILENALEALDSGLEKDTDNIDEDSELKKGKEPTDGDKPKAAEEESGDEDVTDTNDPSADVEDLSLDEGNSDPSISDTDPVDTGEEKDIIELISFDRTGEGVDADLYRTAVLNLNVKLTTDDTTPVDQETKDALSHWVNGFLYRAAIDETKSRIKALGLQKYLKLFK